MNNIINFLNLNKKSVCVPIEEQRKKWIKEFLKAFFVMSMAYACMYLIRSNFKAGQPLLKEQLGFTTSELGYIGFAFSITYGIGKTLLGYFADGKNTKKIISILLIMSATMVCAIGFILLLGQKPIGIMMLFWGLSGFFQSAGGPCSYSTISRWTPTKKRGRYIGLWNMSHNVGGALAGIVALWGANTFFHGNVAGMFIVPGAIALIIGCAILFIGKDEPEELGWNEAEVIFDEPRNVEDNETETMSKFDIFKKYILKNPCVWILCVANVFTYIVRIGIDNWAPLYVTEQLHFSMVDAVNTLVYFEMGALCGSALWGYISDLLNGRRAVVGIFCLILTAFAVLSYRYAISIAMVNISLFALGALIFGPQVLIGISMVGFVPKKANAVANGITGTFGYLLGDSTAKVALAKIADTKSSGITIGSITLHGWNDVFIVFYFALVFSIILLGFIAYVEEVKIRKAKRNEI